MADSKCMYCGSQVFGPGCVYGPKGMHVHPNSGNGHCIYCDSQATGPGCLYNPYGNVHVQGVDYNGMIRETCANGIITGYLMHRLHEDVKDTPAYKMGLINSKGQIIKKPVTIYEKAALTSMDIYVMRLKKLLGPEAALIQNVDYLKESKLDLDSSTFAKMYELELQNKEDIQNAVNQLLECTTKAVSDGFNSTQIEQMIIEAILPKG